jgi:addiction module HigA family antidote
VKRDSVKIKPTHPGDVLREDYLKPLGMTPNALALALRVPASRIGEIVNGKRSVTAETAIRLARYFGGTALFWLNMQAYFDLAKVEDKYAAAIEREVQPHAGMLTAR